MSFAGIGYEISAGVATVTLNRPDRLNAFTATMGHEPIEAFDLAASDDQVRAVIVAGAGGAFFAGAHLGSGGATFDRRERQEGDLLAGGAPAQRRCARCREPFGCGAGTGSCWCAGEDVSAETLRRLAARYDGCLCSSCLRAAASSVRDTRTAGEDASHLIPPA